MPFWQFYQKLASWLDWPAVLVQPSISAHRKWPEMVVSASTNQVWTKIIIGSYAHVLCHSESDTSGVSYHAKYEAPLTRKIGLYIVATITFSSYLNLCGWAIPNQVVIVQLILLCAKMDCNCHYHLFNRSFVWNGHGYFKWLWQNQNIIHNSIEISLDLERMLSNLAEVYNQDHFVSFWYSFACTATSQLDRNLVLQNLP